MPLSPAAFTFCQGRRQAGPARDARRVDAGLVEDVLVVVQAERVRADRDAVRHTIDRARAGQVRVEAAGVDARRPSPVPAARRWPRRAQPGCPAGSRRVRCPAFSAVVRLFSRSDGRRTRPLDGDSRRGARLDILGPGRLVVVLRVRVPEVQRGQRRGRRSSPPVLVLLPPLVLGAAELPLCRCCCCCCTRRATLAPTQ